MAQKQTLLHLNPFAANKGAKRRNPDGSLKKGEIAPFKVSEAVTPEGVARASRRLREKQNETGTRIVAAETEVVDTADSINEMLDEATPGDEVTPPVTDIGDNPAPSETTVKKVTRKKAAKS